MSFNKFSSLWLPWSSRIVPYTPARRWKETEARHKAKLEQLKKEGTSVQEYNPQDPCPAHISFLRILVCSDKFWGIFNDTLFHLLISISDYTIFWEEGQELWDNRVTTCLQNYFSAFFFTAPTFPRSLFYWGVGHISVDSS